MGTKAERTEQDTFDEVMTAIDAAEVDPDRHVSIQIDRSLREAIRAAQTSGQASGVTIGVKVKPGPDRRVSFAMNVSAKLPRPPVAAVTLYADAGGGLHASDPAQLKMDLQRATHTNPEEN